MTVSFLHIFCKRVRSDYHRHNYASPVIPLAAVCHLRLLTVCVFAAPMISLPFIKKCSVSHTVARVLKCLISGFNRVGYVCVCSMCSHVLA